MNSTSETLSSDSTFILDASPILDNGRTDNQTKTISSDSSFILHPSSFHSDPPSARKPRGGYTLLEVLLAAAIAVLLLGAMYIAMRVQLRNAQDARDAVSQGALVRSLTARIANDISANLCAAPAAAAAAPTSGSPSGGGASSASNGTPSTGTGGSSGSTRSATPNSGTAVVFNLGVLGDSSRVVLYVSRPVRPPSALTGEMVDSDTGAGTCDLRRITYWMVQGSGAASGLARQEVRQVTADEAMSALPPDVPDQESFIIAPEVKNVVFRFFDGTEWREDWDGTAAGANGTTAQGPPAAISIEMSVAVPGSTAERTVRHVVAIQSANGLATSTTTTTAQ